MGRRRTFALLIAIASAAIAIGLPLVVWIWEDLPTAADLAQLLGLFVALPGFTTSLLLYSGPTGATTDFRHLQAELAVQVEDRWVSEAATLGIGTGSFPVRWYVARRIALDNGPVDLAGRVDPELIRSLSEQLGDAPAHEALTRFITDAADRRLLILGGGGAGKTTLAIQLVLATIPSRGEARPVPVHVSLSSWDVQAQPRLEDWLAGQLGQHYPVLRTAASNTANPLQLLKRGLVLPVLDGFDELAEGARPAALKAINRFLVRKVPLVLTSRPEEFGAAAVAAGETLSSAVAVEPRAFSGPELSTYLRGVLPPQHPPAWAGFLELVDSHRGAPVVSALSSPLGLWLFTTAYPPTGSGPGPLLEQDPADEDSVLEHLLAGLVPALLDRDAERDPQYRVSRAHRPAQVTRWLTNLAVLVSRGPGSHGDDETRDFEWWQYARAVLTDLQVWVVLIAVVGSALLAIVLFGFGSVPLVNSGMAAASSHLGTVLAGVVVGIGGGTALWLAFSDSCARWLGAGLDPIEARLRHLLTLRVAGLTLGLLYGTVAGSMVGVARGLSSGVPFGVASGLIFGLASGTTFGLSGEITFRLATWSSSRARASTPLSTMRADKRLCAASTSVVFVSFTLAFGLVVGLAFALANLASGGLIGRASHAWAIYGLGCLKGAATRRFPLRLLRFLGEAERLGLLRAVGPVYQFRHVTVQRHLARRSGSPG